MAYVALSRVRSLNGVHLTDFDPASIIVSTNCLEEINRLRTIYRKDLSLYDIPKAKNCKKDGLLLNLMKKLLHLKSHAMISKTVKERPPCLGRNCLKLKSLK